MPIKKAAKKYMRVTARKTAKNLKIKGLFKSAIKKTNEAIAKKDLAKAQEWFKKTAQLLDKATDKNILHKNTAARKKSRLNKLLKTLAGK
ncbi:MAG: 30S ribosomal protein S20 [Candidatus Moranbacteria bacterium CG10_big_fil_rev_8_21_14_0_10_35_21]|nr:MAG: 30S ribosomal protein S20 [Candidatus Moranbacteria bacterium CG10_big_fil_rev_8_21_14_0_10_35_21]PJA88663.1 MAG: 30S ribosomal protein S20 [Candidatus Moranbacteria bacterium CG_4_9_14_3_um_filter_36_9]